MWPLVSPASLLLLTIPLSLLVAAADVPTTCYVIDGKANSNAGYRCNNGTTGHSSCCAIGAVCWSNGVCQQANGNVQDYLRVGCTDKTWKDPACLDQCAIYATDSTAGIRFCNGAITSTTQYCCDNGTSGVGSFACCGTPSSIFNISPAPTVLAQIPLNGHYSSSSSSSSSATSSTSSSSSTSASTSATPAAVTSPPAATTSAAASSSHAAAIGAGVGVPVGIALLAGIGFLFWRRRKNAKKTPAYEMSHEPAGNYNGYQDHNPSQLPAQEGESLANPYGGMTKPGAGFYAPTPTELPNTQRQVHEIGS